VKALAGVDEAGLGPILGPLVVAGVALSGPDGKDPWQLLRGRVTRHRNVAGRLRVADSKKVHQGPHGLRHLEATVLAFLGAQRGALPASLEELLVWHGVDLELLRLCPWYEDLALPLPLTIPRDELELTSHLLARDLASAGITVHCMAFRPVDVGEFNEWIAATESKARAHFQAYGEVISALLDVLPASGHLVADRAGGRMRYGRDLARLRPAANVRRLHEDARESSYEVLDAGKASRVTFAVEGEDRAFPTALASCMAKYLRELMVERINRWFVQRMPGLRPTAGYWQDGLRFLAEVGSLIETPGFPRGLLVRSR
jgi:ribonuclease HII